MWANCSGHSPKMSDVSKLHRALTKNERPWEICSGCSPKMSDLKQVTQALTKNERMIESLVFLCNSNEIQRANFQLCLQWGFFYIFFIFNLFLSLLKSKAKEKLKSILFFPCTDQKPVCPFLENIKPILISSFILQGSAKICLFLDFWM